MSDPDFTGAHELESKAAGAVISSPPPGGAADGDGLHELTLPGSVRNLLDEKTGRQLTPAEDARRRRKDERRRKEREKRLAKAERKKQRELEKAKKRKGKKKKSRHGKSGMSLGSTTKSHSEPGSARPSADGDDAGAKPDAAGAADDAKADPTSAPTEDGAGAGAVAGAGAGAGSGADEDDADAKREPDGASARGKDDAGAAAGSDAGGDDGAGEGKGSDDPDGSPRGVDADGDKPLKTEDGAEVLHIDMFDPHEVKDDDAAVTDKEFAKNILKGKKKRMDEKLRAEVDIEIDEGLEDGDEDQPWVPPSIYKAIANRDRKYFENGTAPLWNTSLNELGVMGAGVPLYFKMLKYLAVAFTIMTVLSAPIWFLSLSGTGMDGVDQSLDQIGWSRMTIGNARTGRNLETGANNTHQMTIFGGPITGKEVSYAIMVSDLCMAGFFILFIFFVRHKVDKVVQETDANNVTSGDYSVMIHNLPSDATAQEIRRHFDELFQLSDPDWNFEGHCFGWCGKKESRPPQDLEDSGDIQDGEFIMPEDPVDPCRPVADVSNTQDAQYLGGWVAEVAMAYTNGKSLRAYLSARELANDLRSARATVKKYALDTPFDGGPNEKKRLKALQAVDRLESRIEKLKRVCTFNTKNTVAAYVTFNHEESYLRCLDDYEGSGWIVNRFFQPPPLRFRRIHGVTVKAAAEPSNVLWEHLDTSWFSHVMRLFITGFLSILLLAASFALILFAQTNKESFAAVIPHPELCSTHLPASIYGQYFRTTMPAPKLVRDQTPGMCSNARHSFIRFDVNLSNPEHVYSTSQIKEAGLLNGTLGGATEFRGLHDWRAIDPGTNLTVGSTETCWDPCVAPGDNTMCEPLVCHSPRWTEVDIDIKCPRESIGNYSVQALVNCFCLQEMHSYVDQEGFFGWFTVWFSSAPLCETFVREWGLAQILPLAAPLFVTIINAILKVVLTKLARFERHHSTSEENKAVAWKVFLFQFINTALITLIVFGRMPNDVVVPGQDIFQYFTGEFDDFSTKWYAVVGSAMTLTMFVAAFVAHPPLLIKKYIVLPLKRKFKAKKAVTQRELNMLFEGPPFEIEQKIPKVLNALFVTMFYCGGMPLLIPLAAVNFALLFWVDKWLMLRFHTRPPYQNEALVEMTAGLLPYALIFHLAISAWMYGNAEVLDSENLNLDQMFDANAPASIEVEVWLNNTVAWDEIGVAPKLVRQNVFPIAGLGAAVLAVVLIARFFGDYIKAFTLKALRCLLCGYCLTKNTVNPKRNYVPPFTEVFERELDPRFEHELTDQEVKAGWILNTDTEGRQWVAKQWLHDGVVHGLPHYQGQKKRTWEVIRDNDLETYEMTENEVYADFAITAKRKGGAGDEGDMEEPDEYDEMYSDFGSDDEESALM